MTANIGIPRSGLRNFANVLCDCTHPKVLPTLGLSQSGTSIRPGL